MDYMLDPMEIIVNSTGALVYVIDLKTYEVLYANKRCIEEFGHVVGSTCYKVLQRDQNTPCHFCPLHQHEEDPFFHPIGTIFEWENQNSINNRYYMFVDQIVQWHDGRAAKVQVGIDITSQKQLEAKILKEKNDFIHSFEILIDSTLEGIIIYDDTKHCIRVNAVASQLFGYTQEEMIGQHALNFIAPASHDLVKTVIQNHTQNPYEAQMQRKDGTMFPAILRGKDLNLAGKPIRVSAVMDITDIKKKEDEILRLAHYDNLTDLPNRLFLKELLTHMMARIERDSKYGALFFIDLDHFKVVNDTQGHDTGDLVLIETSRRIRDVIRQTDILARFGGDEFVVAIEMDDDDKSIIINKIGISAKKILEEIQKPYFIKDFEFSMSASIGIMLFNDHKYTIDELMKFADSAMYNAKENGRNKYHFFDPKLQQIMELRAMLLARLRKAIENQSFTLFYQPQIIGSNRDIIGVEALIRWIDPIHGIISPANFIPLAEESGLIVPLGEWILREAMKQLKEWERDDIKKFWRISINISAKQFEKENFTDILFSLIKEYQIVPSQLRLELTEGLLFKNTKDALQKLQKIKDFGFTLSIDDFGTGYSSLAYLKQLPIDELKIDQSFIRDLVTDPNDFIIVETILSIGRKFNLEVVAEGVETQEQYEQLLSMGCMLFQGYLFAKPSDSAKL